MCTHSAKSKVGDGLLIGLSRTMPGFADGLVDVIDVYGFDSPCGRYFCQTKARCCGEGVRGDDDLTMDFIDARSFTWSLGFPALADVL